MTIHSSIIHWEKSTRFLISISHFFSQVSSISDFNLPFPFTSHYTSFHFDLFSVLSSVDLNQFFSFFFFQQIQLSRQLYQSHSIISNQPVYNHRTVFRINNNFFLSNIDEETPFDRSKFDEWKLSSHVASRRRSSGTASPVSSWTSSRRWAPRARVQLLLVAVGVAGPRDEGKRAVDDCGWPASVRREGQTEGGSRRDYWTVGKKRNEGGTKKEA